MKPAKYKKIMGVDPGSINCGIVVLESTDDPETVNLIRTYKLCVGKHHDFLVRIQSMVQQLELIIHEPDLTDIAIEKTHIGSNMRTSMHLAQMRGAIVSTALKTKVPITNIHEYQPTTHRKLSLGSGRLSKADASDSLQNKLDNSTRMLLLSEDEVDALGVALACYAEHTKVRAKHVKTHTLKFTALPTTESKRVRLEQ